MASKELQKRRLMWWGMALFLLGLITGLMQNALTNPRMGLSAHLEGLMNGTFLIAVGAIWPNVQLAPRLLSITYGALVFGTVMNWAVTLFAAAVGTSSMTPLAGAGHAAAPWQEISVTIGFVSVGIAMLAAAALLLWGLRGSSLAPAGTVTATQREDAAPPPPA